MLRKLLAVLFAGMVTSAYAQTYSSPTYNNLTVTGTATIPGVASVYNITDPAYGAKCDDTTDDGPAINAAAAALRVAGKGILTGPAGKTCKITTGIDFTKLNASFVYATGVSLVSGGSGCTNGTQTFTGPVSGSGDVGATFQGTVSGGVVQSLTFTSSANGGIYAPTPANPGTLTGGGCSVAPTANITYFWSGGPSYGPVIDLGMLNIDCQVTGGVCIDMIGSKRVTVKSLQLSGNCGSSKPAIGLQYGIPQANPQRTSSQITFNSPQFGGCYSTAARINFGAEVAKTFGGNIIQQEPSFTAVGDVVDCYNHFGLTSQYTTISWPTDTAASCQGVANYGLTVQNVGSKNAALSSFSGNSLTFAALPSNVVVGTAINDATHVNQIPWGTTVTGISGNTVYLSVAPLSPTNGDTIYFGGGPAVWLGGTMMYYFDRGGYVSGNNASPVYIYNESIQINNSLEFDAHIESYPYIRSNFLVTTGVTNTTATPEMLGLTFTGADNTNEANFSHVGLDFANGVTSSTLDQLSVRLAGSISGISANFGFFGLHQTVTAASVSTGGSGCTNGSQTFTIPSNPNGGIGISAQITGTVTTGALSGALTITSGGTYAQAPATSPVTLSGGNCSVAPTVTLTVGNLGAQPFTANGRLDIGSTLNTTPATNNGLAIINGTGSSATIRFLGGNINEPNLGNASGTPICLNSNVHKNCTDSSQTGGVTAYSGTSIPVGGTAGSGIKLSNTSNFGVFFGSGVPTLSAAKGSIYLRSDGSSTSTRMYVNTDGSTTWTNVTTAN